MEFKGRALFNVLRINYRDGLLTDVKPWQVEDYRALDDETIFNRLAFLDIHLDEESLLLYINECDSPEELAECLLDENQSVEIRQQIYLLVFELWRRYGTDKQSISIFCDELDHIIEAYEDGEEEARESLFQSLEALEDILDESVDQGNKPQRAFQEIKSFLCHDLEAFLFEFISGLIDKGHETYPSELIDAFYEYYSDTLWLDLLRIRLLALVDLTDTLPMLERLLEELEETPNFQLYLEVLKFLTYVGDSKQFHYVFEQAITVLRTEEDLDELLDVAMNYFHTMEKPEEEKEVRSLIESRGELPPMKVVDTDSETYHKLIQLVVRVLSLQEG